MNHPKISHLQKKIKACAQLFYHTVINPKAFPFWAYINLTRGCNLSCPYCYVLDNGSIDMSVADVLGIINKLSELHTQWVSFTGGEPTLVKDTLLSGIEHASLRKKMFTQLPTNGYLLDESYLMLLGETGLDLLDISLDTLEKSHSQKGLEDRQPEMFESVIKARSQYHFVVKVNTVITRENLHKISDLLNFTGSHGILLSVRLGSISPLPQPFPTSNDAHLLKSADLEEIRAVVRLLKSAKINGFLITEPFSYFDLWEKFITSPKEMSWGCEASTYNLNFDPDGMLRLCNNLPVKEGLLPLHYSELTKDYYKVLKEPIETFKKQCQPDCLVAAYFCSHYYRKHPLHFMSDRFFSRY
ncbi:MAG: radical SAM protein [Candidatus Margulisiibacteriota bacterium]